MKEVYVNESDCSSVLTAIVKCLNEGQFNTCASDIDRTISANDGPAFTLQTSKGTFKACELDIMGNPLGCRTNIFFTNEISRDLLVYVIKEQTIKCRKHWKEKIIMNKIYQHSCYKLHSDVSPRIMGLFQQSKLHWKAFKKTFPMMLGSPRHLKNPLRDQPISSH